MQTNMKQKIGHGGWRFRADAHAASGALLKALLHSQLQTWHLCNIWISSCSIRLHAQRDCVTASSQSCHHCCEHMQIREIVNNPADNTQVTLCTPTRARWYSAALHCHCP